MVYGTYDVWTRYGRQQQWLQVPGLEPVGREQRSHRLLRRSIGVYHRWHGIRGQSFNRKVTQIVHRTEDHIPVDQTETRKRHSVSVSGTVWKSGKHSGPHLALCPPPPNCLGIWVLTTYGDLFLFTLIKKYNIEFISTVNVLIIFLLFVGIMNSF